MNIVTLIGRLIADPELKFFSSGTAISKFMVANGYKVNNKYVYASAHFVIDLDGTIYQLIPTDEISYATNSANPYTISVEVATTGIDNHYTDATYKSMVHLCAWLCQYKKLSC